MPFFIQQNCIFCCLKRLKTRPSRRQPRKLGRFLFENSSETFNFKISPSDFLHKFGLRGFAVAVKLPHFTVKLACFVPELRYLCRLLISVTGEMSHQKKMRLPTRPRKLRSNCSLAFRRPHALTGPNGI